MEVWERCEDCKFMFVVSGNPLVAGHILCDDCERIKFYEEADIYA